MTHRLYYYQLVWTLAHWPIFHAQTRDAILRYISPPPHCVCIHNRTCRINWRHASATVTSCPFYFRVTHTHTNWTRPSVANGLDAKCQQGHKSRAAGQPNNNKVSTVPTDFFQSGSEPGAHIVCEMFPHGKEKKIQQKNPNYSRCRRRIFRFVAFAPDCAMESSMEKNPEIKKEMSRKKDKKLTKG